VPVNAGNGGAAPAAIRGGEGRVSKNLCSCCNIPSRATHSANANEECPAPINLNLRQLPTSDHRPRHDSSFRGIFVGQHPNETAALSMPMQESAIKMQFKSACQDA